MLFAHEFVHYWAEEASSHWADFGTLETYRTKRGSGQSSVAGSGQREWSSIVLHTIFYIPELLVLNICLLQPLSKNGDIQVSLNYNPSLHRLTVVVLRARGLQCDSDAGKNIFILWLKTPRFYELTCIMGGSGVCVQVSLKIHTQVVRNKWTTVAKGNNPSFKERLTFRLLPVQLDTACLSLQLQQPITEEPGNCLSIIFMVIV